LKLVFIDSEFTGEHGKATLVSLGLITLDNKKLNITFNDYDKSQVTKWLKNNVLSKINKKKSIDSKSAYKKVSKFLKNYSKGHKIHLVSAGKTLDIVLLFDLYKYAKCKKKFHWLHDLPKYLNHSLHLDLNTMIFFSKFKNVRRIKLANLKIKKKEHDALYDATVIRACFLKLLKYFPQIKKKINIEKIR
jgi:DNA polymerase III epsilon subunit-like protein